MLKIKFELKFPNGRSNNLKREGRGACGKCDGWGWGEEK